MYPAIPLFLTSSHWGHILYQWGNRSTIFLHNDKLSNSVIRRKLPKIKILKFFEKCLSETNKPPFHIVYFKECLQHVCVSQVFIKFNRQFYLNLKQVATINLFLRYFTTFQIYSRFRRQIDRHEENDPNMVVQ